MAHRRAAKPPASPSGSPHSFGPPSALRVSYRPACQGACFPLPLCQGSYSCSVGHFLAVSHRPPSRCRCCARLRARSDRGRATLCRSRPGPRLRRVPPVRPLSHSQAARHEMLRENAAVPPSKPAFPDAPRRTDLRDVGHPHEEAR